MKRSQVEEIIIQWAAKELTTVEAATKLAHQLDREIYFGHIPMVLQDEKTAELLAALFRELARDNKNAPTKEKKNKNYNCPVLPQRR